MKNTRLPLLARLLLPCLALILSLSSGAVADGALPGYRSPDEINARLRALESPGLATVISLGRTAQGRELLCLRIGSGDADSKPAIAVLGSVQAQQRVGAELVVRMAEGLIQSAASEKTAGILAEHTYYLIPEPSPDAASACFTSPLTDRAGNSRPWDDDKDGGVDEDGPDDLDGDGWITQLRVKDPAGRLMPHPLDPRVLIEADASKGERGVYSIYTEGLDDDVDGSFNEDGRGGVDFNRNWSFDYPAYQADAGLNAVSEPECRALADFLFARSNIALVFSFSPQDNLSDAWKAGQSQPYSIMNSILGGDAPAYELLSKRYKELLDPKDAPAARGWSGSFSAWAYFHFGRWSLSSAGWWPRVPAAEAAEVAPVVVNESSAAAPVAAAEPAPAARADAPSEQPAAATSAAGPEWDKDDKRGERELNWLKWMDSQGLEGFAAWQPYSGDTRKLPDGEVEVGGMRMLRMQNPPAAELDALAGSFAPFLEALPGLLPRLELGGVKCEALGDGLYRASATLVNSGQLPTMPQLAENTALNNPLQAEVLLPGGSSLLTGTPRRRVGRLLPGASTELNWLIYAPQGGSITLRAWSPSVGSVEASVELSSGGGK